MGEELSYSEVDLLEEIILDARENGGVCTLSDKELLSSTNVSERTYYRLLRSLEAKGIITRSTQSVGYYGKKRRIIVNFSEGDAKYNT